jgi:hypothetical protein
MGTLLQDVRYGLRMLVKNPTFSQLARLEETDRFGSHPLYSIRAVLGPPLPCTWRVPRFSEFRVCRHFAESKNQQLARLQ